MIVDSDFAHVGSADHAEPRAAKDKHSLGLRMPKKKAARTQTRA
jgi:hypothetical protein